MFGRVARRKPILSKKELGSMAKSGKAVSEETRRHLEQSHQDR